MKTSQLSTANKLLILLIFLQIWMGAITFALITANRFKGLDVLGFTLFIIMFVGYIVTFFAIFNDAPPFHLLVYPAALANLALSISPPDTINISLSVLTLYFQLRHPIEVRHKPNFRLPERKPRARKKKGTKK